MVHQHHHVAAISGQYFSAEVVFHLLNNCSAPFAFCHLTISLLSCLKYIDKLIVSSKCTATWVHTHTHKGTDFNSQTRAHVKIWILLAFYIFLLLNLNSKLKKSIQCHITHNIIDMHIPALDLVLSRSLWCMLFCCIPHPSMSTTDLLFLPPSLFLLHCVKPFSFGWDNHSAGGKEIAAQV